MQSGVVHQARDLAPDLRRAVETLLGRALQEDETVSVRAFKGSVLKEAPSGNARDEAYRRLVDRIDRTAKRAEGVPGEEVDAVIDEAIDSVRRRRG